MVPQADDVIDWLLTVHYERLATRKTSCMLAGVQAANCRIGIASLLDAPTDQRPTLHCRSSGTCCAWSADRSETSGFRESEVINQGMRDTESAV
jgi:hypothetical protein